MSKIKYLAIFVFLLIKIANAQSINANELLKCLNCSDTTCVKRVLHGKGFSFIEYNHNPGYYEFELEDLGDTSIDDCGTSINFSFLNNIKKSDSVIQEYNARVDIGGRQKLYEKLLNDFKQDGFVAVDTIKELNADWSNQPFVLYKSILYKKISIITRILGVQPCYNIELTRKP